MSEQIRAFNPKTELLDPRFVHLSKAQFAAMINKSQPTLDRLRKEDPRCPIGFTSSKNPLLPKVSFVASECYIYSQQLIDDGKQAVSDKIDVQLREEVSSASM